MFLIQLSIVLITIFFGSRVGGVGLGTVAATGMFVLIFGFGNPPGSLPIDVIFIIISVITAASALQAAGGLDLMVHWAEKIIRKNPKAITYVAPIVSYFFTFFAGTGHVAYSILPVIAEVSRKAGVRPERPMSISVIASQQAITASPISAATAAMIALFASNNSTLGLKDILFICMPATIIGSLIGAFSVSRMGFELDKDPGYLELAKQGKIKDIKKLDLLEQKFLPGSGKAILIFGISIFLVVLLGLFSNLRPSFDLSGKTSALSMATTIEMIMLACAALIMMVCRTKSEDLVGSSVMRAGIVAVISILGVAWLGSTFFETFQTEIVEQISHTVQIYPWIFSIGLFALSILLYSQAATVAALMGVGVALEIPMPLLVAMFPAVNGYFFLPTYGTIIAAISFDQTGTTSIGKYLLNHSFMRPGLVSTISSIALGMVIVRIFYL